MSKHTRLLGWILLTALISSASAAQTVQPTDEIIAISISLSGDETSLDLELSDGRSLQVRLLDGRVYVAGEEVGRYEPGGTFETAWRDMLRRAADGDFGEAWAGFAASDFSDAGLVAGGTIASAIEAALSAPAATSAAAPTAEETAVAAAIGEAAAIAEAVQEGTISRETVSGGLIVELTELEGLARSLSRIGLTGELSRELNGALVPPMRIVLEADEYRLAEGSRLPTSLWLVETDGLLAGTVAGNVFVADGSLIIEPTAVIEGDLITLDATVENLGGTIMGEMRDLEGAISPVVVAQTLVRATQVAHEAPGVLHNVLRGVGTIMQTVAAYLIFGLIGALVVYFFRPHLETVSDTVSYSFGRSFLTGLAAQLLFLPVMLVLIVLVLTWIVLPVYVVGFILAVLLGYLAVAHAAGENLTRRRYPSWVARMRRSNSYYYVLSGLAVLLGFFAAAGVAEMGGALLAWAYGLLVATAMTLTWIASTAGLGAAMLSRGGTQRKYARPHQIPRLPIELPADSLEEKMETIQRRTEAPRQPRTREADDES